MNHEQHSDLFNETPTPPAASEVTPYVDAWTRAARAAATPRAGVTVVPMESETAKNAAPRWTAAQHTGKVDKRLGVGWCVNGIAPAGPMELPERIADCYGLNARKHAQTIAAIPDLLAALQNVVDDADDTGCDDCYVVSRSLITSLRSLLQSLGATPGADVGQPQ